MIYLVIMILVAGTGLTSLWVQQRRERRHLETVDGFRSSLERLSEAPLVIPRRRATAPVGAAAPPRRRTASGGRPTGRARGMDPARRDAARQRIEARRRAARARAL